MVFNKKYKSILCITIFAISTCFFLLPTKSGILGYIFLSIMFYIFGTASYVFPLICLRYFFILKKNNNSINIYSHIISTLVIVSYSVFFEGIHLEYFNGISGGHLGYVLYLFLNNLFDLYLSFTIITLLLIYSTIKFLEQFVSFFYIKTKILNNLFKANIAISVTKKQQDNNNIQMLKLNNYRLPQLNLLKQNKTIKCVFTHDELLNKAKTLEKVILDFGINVKVVDILTGVFVNRYDIILAPGIRIQMLFNIVDNIAFSMHVPSVRIIPIHEKAVIGIEIPNLSSSRTVYLKDILSHDNFKMSRSILSLALGIQMNGNIYIADLAKMPHILIAGTTGSGKSISLHTIIMSILYKAKPNEVKFILIDPKHVEMLIYNNLPHLYNPMNNTHQIITTPKEAFLCLKKLISIMNFRYTQFSKETVRNIEEYNNKMMIKNKAKEFYIVVIIDEMADLMITTNKDIESVIQRLSQMSRAVGIHLIIATQRPSVNVLTGVIKANFPARLSLKTTSKIDSKVILDMYGAEQLIGKGDMLFLPPGAIKAIRIQGAFISSSEIQHIVTSICNQKKKKKITLVSKKIEFTK
jgi:S-DNA-T family DNA segregation ATPase FtsK/SpoIIIE